MKTGFLFYIFVFRLGLRLSDFPLWEPLRLVTNVYCQLIEIANVYYREGPIINANVLTEKMLLEVVCNALFRPEARQLERISTAFVMIK